MASTAPHPASSDRAAALERMANLFLEEGGDVYSIVPFLPSLVKDTPLEHALFEVDPDVLCDVLLNIWKAAGTEFVSHELKKPKPNSPPEAVEVVYTLLGMLRDTPDVHQNVGKECAGCTFHLESLKAHSVTACIITTLKCLHESGDEKLAFMAGFTALVHDLGKISTVKIVGFDRKYPAYPFHGETGSMILTRAWCEAFEAFFTKDEWEAMCRAVCVHMCSYHVTDYANAWALERATSVAHESVLTKVLLHFLSWGDEYGRVPENPPTQDLFAETREQWKQAVRLGEKISPSRVRKMLILLNGASGQGKSHAAAAIIELLKKLGYRLPRVVSRDAILCKMAAELSGGKITVPEDGRPTGKLYKMCYDIYKKHKLGEAVNRRFAKVVEEASNDPEVDVIVLDTMALAYQGAEKLVPPSVLSWHKVSVWCSNNGLHHDSGKNGLSEAEQNALTGEFSAVNPLPPGKINTGGLQSMYCLARQGEGLNPHAVFTISGTSACNGENTVGLKPLLDYVAATAPAKEQAAPVEEEAQLSTDDMNIVRYVQYLFRVYRGDASKVRAHFKALFIKANGGRGLALQDENVLLHIKYMEHFSVWDKAWARQTRGTGFMVLERPDKRLVHLTKMQMQRGAELLTGYQVARGIKETENAGCEVEDPRAAMLSKEQRELMRDLLNNSSALDLAVTAKKDGSLLTVGLYSGAIAAEYRRLIDSLPDEDEHVFTKAVMALWDEVVGNTDTVLVFMSQGTSWLGISGQDYNTTALFPEACGKGLTPTQKIVQYGRPLLERLRGFFSELEGDQFLVMFETICAGRMTDLGDLHRELAVSYEESSATLISATCIKTDYDNANDTFVQYPHWAIEELCDKHGFKQPAFWRVSSTQKLDDMLTSLDDVIRGKMSVAGFYELYPPENKGEYDTVVDVEGFVVYDRLRGNSYSKVKTDAYYRSHKFNSKNVGYLVELAKTAGHLFPLAAKVASVYEALDDPETMSDIRSSFLKFITDPSLAEALPEKARKGYSRATYGGKCRIIINTSPCKEMVAQEGARLFTGRFPGLLASDKFDAGQFALNFAMWSKVWENDPVELIDSESRRALTGELSH